MDLYDLLYIAIVQNMPRTCSDFQVRVEQITARRFEATSDSSAGQRSENYMASKCLLTNFVSRDAMQNVSLSDEADIENADNIAMYTNNLPEK